MCEGSLVGRNVCLQGGGSQNIVCLGRDGALCMKPCMPIVGAAIESVGDLGLGRGSQVVQEPPVRVPLRVSLGS